MQELSAEPCGCDKGANHICQRHLVENLESIPPLAQSQCLSSATVPIASSSEQTVVDPLTGGAKGQKLQRFSLIPRDFLWGLAEHYGKGAAKYGDYNWTKGYKWSLSVDALERHLSQWLGGEDDDPETGSSHLFAVCFHIIALWWWHKRGLGTDDVRQK